MSSGFIEPCQPSKVAGHLPALTGGDGVLPPAGAARALDGLVERGHVEEHLEHHHDGEHAVRAGSASSWWRQAYHLVLKWHSENGFRDARTRGLTGALSMAVKVTRSPDLGPVA
jgi:hypothetical protein